MSTTVYATQDVYTAASSGNGNFEGNNLLVYGSGSRMYSYIEFDLSSVAEDIEEALIKLYIVTNGLTSNTTIRFYRISKSWDASEVTYNEPPTITSTSKKTKTIDPTDENWEQWNVTDLVKDIISNGGYGLRIEIDANHLVEFSSMEGDHPPKLVITEAEVLTGRVRGIVRDRNETPVAGASVNVEGKNVVSGSDGYTPYVNCTPGDDLRTATVTPPAGYTCWEGKCTRDYFCVVGDKDLIFWFDAPIVGRVRGIVRDRDVNPIAGASVNVEGTDVVSGSDGYTPYVNCAPGGDIRTATVTPPAGYICWKGRCAVDYICENLDKDIVFWFEVRIVSAPPIITWISWSPKGDYTTLAAGASIFRSVAGGGTTSLMLVATDPADASDPPLSEGDAILQIDHDAAFTVSPGGHFRFNDMDWIVRHIICGPECDMITIADEVAQSSVVPKLGDSIQFSVNIDWQGKEIGSVKWYYAKAPNKCFKDIDVDLDWTLFAVDTTLPAYTFDTEGDTQIAFFMVTATNKAGDSATLHNVCGPIFNLWQSELTGLLEIQFNSGTLYQYINIPKEMYDALLSASSKGRYFWNNIRGETVKYPYRRVR